MPRKAVYVPPRELLIPWIAHSLTGKQGLPHTCLDPKWYPSMSPIDMKAFRQLHRPIPDLTIY